MARIPYAAEQLRDQVLAAKPRAKVERAGEPDGFGVYRSISVSKAAAKWLEPLLAVIEDQRIDSVDYDEDGRLVVTFSPTTAADSRDPFPLDEVEQVLSE